jgi:hypothetical protein
VATHAVTVSPLPAWLDRARLLGAGPWTHDGPTASASLDTRAAADLAARLRGLGLDGVPIELTVTPPLHRNVVRDARTEDARRRRDTTPGFTKSGTQTDDEGRWSLTPESLALRTGQDAAKRLGPSGRVLDAGCGIGGNSLGFARAGLTVLAVSLFAHTWELRIGGTEDAARAAAFASLIAGNVGLIAVNRSWTRTAFGSLGQPNKAAWAVMIGAVVGIVAILEIGPVRNLFKLAWPDTTVLLCSAAAAIVSLGWFEILKVARPAWIAEARRPTA